MKREECDDHKNVRI